MKPEYKIIIGASLFSFIPVAVFIGGQSGVFSLLLGRMAIAVCFLLIFSDRQNYFTKLFYKKFLLLFFWSILMAMAMIAYFFSIQLTGIAISSAVLGTQPVFVILLSILFIKQSVPKLIWPAGILTFIGVICVSLQDNHTQNTNWTGIALALLSSLLLSIIFIFQKIKLNEFNGKALVFYQSLLQIPIILPFCFNENIVVDFNYLIAIVLLGLVCTVMAYSLLFEGIKSVNASKIGILQSTEYVLPALFGIFLFNETHLPLTITGIILILFSCVLINTKSQHS